MRLQRLDLIRYGKFTDYSIDFGRIERDGSDFHIIYGLNEAGKSTTLSAYLDLLFGIEHKSNYGFKHKYDAMEIGATLDISGQSLGILRNKSRKNSLRDGAGEPLDVGLLDTTLAGLGRGAYVTMFSLDDDSLEQGGESILNNQGHLGELLYSASSGVAGLTQRLEELRSDADSFYKSRGQKHQLGDLLSELDALKRTRDDINDKADEYAQLVAIRDNCLQKYNEVLQERTENRLQVKKISTLLTAKPRYDELEHIKTQLNPLLSLPDVPDNWSQDLPQLESNTNRLKQKKDECNDSITLLEQELKAISVDELVLQAKDRISELDGSRARHRLKMENRPEFCRKLQNLDHNLTTVLTKLEQPQDRNAKELLFNISTVAALEELIERNATLDMVLRSAQSEFDKVEKNLQNSRAGLENAAGESQGNVKIADIMHELERAIAPFEGNSLSAQKTTAQHARDDAEDERQRVWARLKPWEGEQELLSGTSVPDSDSIRTLASELNSAQQRLVQVAAEELRLEDELNTLEAQVRSTGQTVGVVNDAEFTTLRKRRDQAWVEHRNQLSDLTADTFKKLLDADDQAQFTRIHNADAVASLNQTTKQLIEREAQLSRAREKHQTSQQQNSQLKDSLEKIAISISPALGGLSATALIDWLGARESALDIALKVKKLTRESGEIEHRISQAESTVLRALEAAKVQVSDGAELDQLLGSARLACGRMQELVSLQEKLQDAEHQVANRQQNLQDAQAALDQWQKDWQSLCTDCWLGESGSVPTPKAVKEIINEVKKLDPWLSQRDELISELDALELNQNKIEEDVRSMGSHLSINLEGLEPDEQFEKILQLLSEAISADIMRNTKLERLQELKDESSAVNKELELSAQTTGEMYRCFGLSTLAGVREKLEQVKDKTRLQAQAQSEQKQLFEILSVATIDEVSKEFETFDRDQFERNLAELEAKTTDFDTRAQELYADLQKAEMHLEAIGSDSDAARLEEQREVLELDIIDKTKNYLALRLGILAAEKALNRFRDRHRSSMLQQASTAFNTISRGAYTRLETQATANVEKLIGIAADGSSKQTGDMSKGTRFQLYLALRVAGYHEYVKSRPSLPFIADDIMETFDDERAAEAFRVFANMAGVGQVIYLTHHEHLCDIAKSVCPSVNIHKLDAQA